MREDTTHVTVGLDVSGTDIWTQSQECHDVDASGCKSKETCSPSVVSSFHGWYAEASVRAGVPCCLIANTAEPMIRAFISSKERLPAQWFGATSNTARATWESCLTNTDDCWWSPFQQPELVYRIAWSERIHGLGSTEIASSRLPYSNDRSRQAITLKKYDDVQEDNEVLQILLNEEPLEAEKSYVLSLLSIAILSWMASQLRTTTSSITLPFSFRLASGMVSK